MTQLTDLQRTLLTTAAQRADGSLLPAPNSIDLPAFRIRKAAERLVALGLADEAEVTDGMASWRAAGDAWIGAVITDAGREQVPQPEPAGVGQAKAEAEVEPQSAPKGQIKTDAVLALLISAES